MKKYLVLCLALIPGQLLAHPGHDGDVGQDGYTIYHFFNSPEHYLSLLGLIVTAGVIYFVRKRMTAKSMNNA